MKLKFTRSQQDRYRECPKRYWFENLANPVRDKSAPGIEPSSPILALVMGLSVHKGMEGLFKFGGDVGRAVDMALAEWEKLTTGKVFKPSDTTGQLDHDYFIAEQRALITALLWAWRIQFWDQFNNSHEIVMIEKELDTQVGQIIPTRLGEDNFDVHLQSRCDLVVRRREDMAIIVPDWKCVKDARDWNTKFQMDSQTWCQSRAVSVALNEPIVSCIYFAFIKGDRRGGMQCSPLIYGYKKELSPGNYQYSSEYQRASGWSKFPIWQHKEFGNSERDRLNYWVNWLGPEVLSSQFCQTEEIVIDHTNSPLVDEWLQDSIDNTKFIHQNQGDQSKFPRHPSYWNCKKCWARNLCDGSTAVTTELECGTIQPRKDHHLEEAE